MRRYNTAQQEPTQARELTDDDRKCCFTSNYLIFNLSEKMPALTSIYLEQEDNVLDYCKTVNFNRNLASQQTLLDKVLEETQEIDGDALLSVVQKPDKSPEKK